MDRREKTPKEKPSQPPAWQPHQGPTNEVQMAAAAALARLEQKQARARGPTSQDSIWNQVRKELRAEATVNGNPEALGNNTVQEPKEEGSAHLAVPGVYFTCLLTGAILQKDQQDARIREAILMVSALPAAGAAPRSLKSLAASAASPPGCAPVLC